MFQIACPLVLYSVISASSLNCSRRLKADRLQAVGLNPVRRTKPRDKVSQTDDNYYKDVFNGDIGIAERIDSVEPEVSIRFDGRLVKSDYGKLDEVSLAYLVSIHKSQESKFPAVVILLAMQHHMLLHWNLFYTGITRGKRLLVFGVCWAKEGFGYRRGNPLSN